MTIVARKGKLSLKSDGTTSGEIAWQRIEDVLTADVFGVYRYLPLSHGLIPFLRHARDETGKTLQSYLHEHGVDLEGMRYARITLWPSFDDGSEPDGVILVGSSPEHIRFALLIEAKLHSSQHHITGSGNVTRSQIGHYAIEHLRGHYATGVDAADLPDLRLILYINRFAECPKDELRTARREVTESHAAFLPRDIGLFWASWLSAEKEAESQWHLYRREVAEKPWLRLLLDLREDLSARSLLPHQSFRALPAVISLPDEGIFSGKWYHCRPSWPLPKQPGAARRYGADTPFSHLPDRIYAQAQEV